MTPCDELKRWLDEGRPEAGAAVQAHATACRRCRRELAADAALQAALRAAPLDRAPRGLVEGVVAEMRASAVSGPAPGSGWRLLAEPWVVAGAAGAVAVGVSWGTLSRAVAALGQLPAPGPVSAPGWPALPVLERTWGAWVAASGALPPLTLTGLALALAAAATGAGWLVWRWSEALAMGRA